MKKSIHDGSVTYSITVPNHAPGEGKHAKTPDQILRRHSRYQLERLFKDIIRIRRNINDYRNFR